MFSKGGVIKNSTRSVPSALKVGYNKKEKNLNNKRHKININTIVPKKIDVKNVKNTNNKSVEDTLFGLIPNTINAKNGYNNTIDKNIKNNKFNKDTEETSNKHIVSFYKQWYNTIYGDKYKKGITTNGGNNYFEKTIESFKRQYSIKNNVPNKKTLDQILEENMSKSFENSKRNIESVSLEKIKDDIKKNIEVSKKNLKNNAKKLYDKDIKIISKFTAGLFNLEVDKEDSGFLTNAGAVTGGIIESVEESIEGVYSTITNPKGVIEDLGNFLFNFDENIVAINNYTKEFWENATTEEKFRASSKLIFDIATSIPTGGSKGALKGVSIVDKTSDMNKLVGKGADISRATDMLPNKGKGRGVNIVIEEVEPANISKIIPNGSRKKEINAQIKDFDPKKATRIQKGNYGEFLTELEMYEMGDLENIMLDNVKLKTINDSTHQGIDLIFKNNTPPPEIVIVESKFKTQAENKKPLNEAPLTKNKSKSTQDEWKIQMDDKWIEKNLEKALGKEKSDEIIKLLDQDKGNYKLNGNTSTVNVLKLVSLIDQTGNVRYFEIGRNGETLRELSKIDIEQILK